LLDDDATIAKKIKTAVTDSGREVSFDPVGKPGVSNLLTMQQALTGTSMDDLVTGYQGRGYGDLKRETAEVVVEFVRPIRSRVQELMDDQGELQSLMATGAHKARITARQTLEAVYEAVGFVELPPE
ncbi:MAG: tryptophan--tRNA ligase, partial [Actinomycetales bacterium]